MSILKRFLAWAKTVNWDTEPVVIMGIIKAVLAALAGAGLTVSDHQVAAITAYVTAACLILATVITRAKVTSPATVAARQAGTDAHLAAASEALANAGPAIQNRARLCPGAPGTFAGGLQAIQAVGISIAQMNADWARGGAPSFDPHEPVLSPQEAYFEAQVALERQEAARGPHPEYKLGRLVNHDEASRQYAITELPAEKIVSRRWGRRAPVFDQGQVGSCTANAACGWLVTDDAFRQGVTVLADGTPVDEKMCLSVYSAAETIDGDGPYPPNDNGSSGLSVAKVLKQRGLCSSYLHAFTLSAVYTALQTGPGMAGTVWYNSMFNTAADGHIHVDKTSGVAGGHEYLIDELEVAADGTVQKIWMQNSWGTGWGVGGRGWFTPAEFGGLLAASGDFTQPAPAVVPAPTPAPVPTPPPGPAPGPDASFQSALDAVPGLDAWLAKQAVKHQMTVPQYLAGLAAGRAGLR